MANWTAAEVPRQDGRTFVVTGANSGLGASTARELARVGAHVVLACRNLDKGKAAADTMPGSVEVRQLDLADLSSVRTFAAESAPLDVLVNNAGVMAVAHATTADGFEMQIGTNHLGHFALTGLLLPKISDRVVTLSSNAHRVGRVRLDDLNWEHRIYRRWPAYAQSKLANLLFAYELNRRLVATRSAVRSIAAHPGYAATELGEHSGSLFSRVIRLGDRILAQPADNGALATLYAATMDVPGGSYIGPDRLLELRGHPKLVRSSPSSRDPDLAGRLWDQSERLTGIRYP
ncbi:MAG TPA: oxidoreductase [Jatrophihabitantaceae bacterium]|nr:oxidoreductase [Jatrophihabitantaceae bacterium]